MVSAFVAVPANAAAIGFIGSRRIRFTSSHGCCDGLATITGDDSKYEILHHSNADIGNAVPQILRQWLQAWRPSFAAPSWEHILVLVVGALLAPGKQNVSSCLRMPLLWRHSADHRYAAALAHRAVATMARHGMTTSYRPRIDRGSVAASAPTNAMIPHIRKLADPPTEQKYHPAVRQNCRWAHRPPQPTQAVRRRHDRYGGIAPPRPDRREPASRH